MQNLLSFFWQMCLFKAGPDRAPTSNQFLILILSTYFLISISSLLIYRAQLTFFEIIASVTVAFLVEATCTWLLLFFKNVPGRFRATLVALIGCSSVLYLLMIPVGLLNLSTDSATIAMFTDTANLLFLGWWLAIAGFIFHRAIDVSIFQGSALALAMNILSLAITITLIPNS